ncbi:MAG: LptA/OstA family protein [Puniceicoccales bacterium]|jgi:lipopolysaccharide export system protein LptA|nr:LptA/OstA family protein [Puniceicoccales bacterium]
MFMSFSKTINRKANKWRLLLFPIALLPPISAGTVPGTSITSDQLEVALQGDQTDFFFEGNVKLTSPEFSAECAAARITTSGTSVDLASGLDSIEKISATGPIYLNFGERSCSADRAEITPVDKTITLLGKATARDTMGAVSGDEIRINYGTKSVVISSGEAQNPVSVNLSQPTENKGDSQNKPTEMSPDITSKSANISAESKDDLPNKSTEMSPDITPKSTNFSTENKGDSPK